MQNENILLLQNAIQNHHNFIITSHRNPDGDAVGSSLALYHVLKNMGKSVNVILPNELPDFLHWLPATEDILYHENHKELADKLLAKAEIVFSLDYNILSRVGDQMATSLSNLSSTFIMIDHHQMPDDFATITFSNTNFGSTCEYLYEILKSSNFQNYINKAVATCLYTGIVTDSGSFRFVKTSSQTHKNTAELIDYGVDNPNVHIQLFNNGSLSRLQLMGKAFQHLVVLNNKKTAFTYLSSQDLQQSNYQKGDTEGLVNYGLTLKDIDLSAIFIEKADENIIKISFRSEGNFYVNEFARTYFDGGGHQNAAGGKSTESLSKTIERFEKIIDEIR